MTLIADIGLSDHKLIYGIGNKVVKQHTKKTINGRSMRYQVLEEFQDLKDIEWFQKPPTPINKQYTHWKTEFTKTMNKHTYLLKI